MQTEWREIAIFNLLNCLKNTQNIFNTTGKKKIKKEKTTKPYLTIVLYVILTSCPSLGLH